jgi:hypothetical protein
MEKNLAARFAWPAAPGSDWDMGLVHSLFGDCQMSRPRPISACPLARRVCSETDQPQLEPNRSPRDHQAAAWPIVCHRSASNATSDAGEFGHGCLLVARELAMLRRPGPGTSAVGTECVDAMVGRRMP